jgi:hypothetical protein
VRREDLIRVNPPDPRHPRAIFADPSASSAPSFAAFAVKKKLG